MLPWVSDKVKDMAKALNSRIDELLEVAKVFQGRECCFYHGEAKAKNLFAAFLLTENSLRVRIKTDPGVEFEDPERWTGGSRYRTYFLWLVGKKQEREFIVTSIGQIEYAVKLITQSYLQTRPIPHEQLKSSIRAYHH